MRRAIASLSLVAALAATTALIASPTMASVVENEPSERLHVDPMPEFGPPDPPPIDPVPALDLGETNLDLFASLDDRGQCLLRSSVYPAGGVGFADSSLPYDDLGPLDRAYSIVRAEIIRNTMDEMAGVTEVRDESGAITTIVVHIIPGAPSYANGIDAIIDNGRPELREAYAWLRDENGFEAELSATAIVSLTESCRVQDEATAILMQADVGGFETYTDATTGQLFINVQPGMSEQAAPALAEFGDAVLLDEFPVEMGVSIGFSFVGSG